MKTIKQLYIENCEKFDEYQPDGSCRKGLRMPFEGFEKALSNCKDNFIMPVIETDKERELALKIGITANKVSYFDPDTEVVTTAEAYQFAKEYAEKMCEKQREICAKSIDQYDAFNPEHKTRKYYILTSPLATKVEANK